MTRVFPTLPQLPGMKMTRWKAARIHFSISLSIAILVGVLLYFLWFPQPYFVAAGASALMLLLMGVDVCIGPLLTAIVFSPGKKRRAIHFDLAVIATLQAIAFVYGAYVICQARPVFVVGEVDRLVLVAAEEIAPDDLAKATTPEARVISWRGPRLVGASPPTGAVTFDLVTRALANGKDIDSMPEYFVPYARVAPGLLRHAFPVENLRGLSARQQRRLNSELQTAQAAGHGLMFLPLERRDHFYTVIVRNDNAIPVAVFDTDPWTSGSISK